MFCLPSIFLMLMVNGFVDVLQRWTTNRSSMVQRARYHHLYRSYVSLSLLRPEFEAPSKTCCRVSPKGIHINLLWCGTSRPNLQTLSYFWRRNHYYACSCVDSFPRRYSDLGRGTSHKFAFRCTWELNSCVC